MAQTPKRKRQPQELWFPQIDVAVACRGRLVTLTPFSDDGRTWLERYVGAPGAHGMYAVEIPRAKVILRAIYRAGGTLYVG
jgi:hypothetical protein